MPNSSIERTRSGSVGLAFISFWACGSLAPRASHIERWASNSMRIATWNLERPRSGGTKKNTAIESRMATINADVWILTETNEVISVDGFTAVPSPPVSGYHAAGENFTTVVSRWPVQRRLPTSEPSLSVCVEVMAPTGPWIVYGTIIPYANYRGVDGTSKRWVEHRKSIEARRLDWVRLRAEHPDHSFVVAGDFNQSRDGSGWYEDPESVMALTGALSESSLACVTQGDLSSEFKLGRSTIDHICLGGGLVRKRVHVGAWPGTTESGVRISDHNGVYVNVDA